MPNSTTKPSSAARQTVVLVACAATKLPQAAPARTLYCSPVFQLSRAYAEQHGAAWYILSAAHGLVNPDQILDPYNVTLAQRSRAQRWSWALQIAYDLARRHAPAQSHLVFLAGETYRATLQVLAIELGYTIATPVQGMGTGQTMAWLLQHTTIQKEIA